MPLSSLTCQGARCQCLTLTTSISCSQECRKLWCVWTPRILWRIQRSGTGVVPPELGGRLMMEWVLRFPLLLRRSVVNMSTTEAPVWSTPMEMVPSRPRLLQSWKVKGRSRDWTGFVCRDEDWFVLHFIQSNRTL